MSAYRTLTEDEAEERLRERCRGTGARIRFAEEARVSPSAISLVLTGRQRLTTKMAAALGLTRHASRRGLVKHVEFREDVL